MVLGPVCGGLCDLLMVSATCCRMNSMLVMSVSGGKDEKAKSLRRSVACGNRSHHIVGWVGGEKYAT